MDKFIDNLAEDLKPVKPLGCPCKRLIPFFVFAVMYLGALIYFEGVRHDIDEKFSDTSFLIENGLMFVLAVSAALCATFLSVPDMCGKKWMIAVPFLTLGLFVGGSVWRSFVEGVHMPHIHFDHCMGEGLFMSAIPLILALFMIRCGATAHPYLSAVMNLLFATGLAYIGLRVTCSMDTVGHATISHLIPYIVVGGLLGLGARKLYKW